ncbi:MAG: prepilin-type N-terminal cleavage/methylation domain-containing protein [Candidatus Pacebacteria bacterium]|nr:prepilin-type N-terminal cleavage/methylation domain-containing protein [Candidatus Paceibacterota bacterium]
MRKRIDLYDSKSFTLVELLIVIGILTILGAVTVLIVKPDQVLKKSRDSRRLSEIQEINKAITIYQSLEGSSFGTANKVYVSLPDSSSTCDNLSLPELPLPYDYACSTAANYRNMDGTGWLPINFSEHITSVGALFSALPIDPINTASSGYYYMYITGGSYELTALLESDKYLQENALADNGTDSGRIETGTDIDLWKEASGLVGYWKLDEGSGTSAADSSGSANTGTWGGTGTHYTTGKVGSSGGQFNGSDDGINVGTGTSLNITDNMSVGAWVYPSEVKYQTPLARSSDYAAGSFKLYLYNDGRINFRWMAENGGDGTVKNCITTGSEYSTGNWYHLIMTFSGGVVRGYKNGTLLKECDQGAITINDSAQPVYIGRDTTNYYLNGLIDEARIYNRVLTAAEILAMYNATK